MSLAAEPRGENVLVLFPAVPVEMGEISLCGFQELVHDHAYSDCKTQGVFKY